MCLDSTTFREAHEAPIYSNATTKKRIISKSEKDRRGTFLLLTFDLQHQKRQKNICFNISCDF